MEVKIDVKDIRKGGKGHKLGTGGRRGTRRSPFDELMAAHRLRELAMNAASNYDTMTAVKAYIMEVELEQFEGEGIFSGGWDSLEVETIDYKFKHEYDLRILHMTHALRESLTEEGDPFQILDVNNDEVLLGSTVPYAGYHQDGTNRMKQRKPIEFNFEHRATIKGIIKEGLLGD